MNNSLLAIEKPALEGYDPQSLLKLPLIFISVCIICSAVIFICHITIFGVPAKHYFNGRGYDYLSIIRDNIIAQFNYYLLYFAIAALMFIYGKLHQISAHSVRLIFIIALLFSVISYLLDLSGSAGIYSDPYLYFPKSKYFVAEDVPFLSSYAYSFLIIIKPLLLIGILKILVTIPRLNKHARLPYKLVATNSKKLCALLFSAILSIIPMLILLHIYPSLIDILNYEFGIAFYSSFKLKLIAATLLIVDFIAIYFVITFLSPKIVLNATLSKFPFRYF